jgi:DNA-binding NarL/FixJ family response regulator
LTVERHTAVYMSKAARAHRGDSLTGREWEILALLAAGLSTLQIAGHLGIAQGTVKTHLTSVYKKIGAQNRVQAARFYLDRPVRRPDA